MANDSKEGADSSGSSMIKTEHRGYELDTLERIYADSFWVAIYINSKKRSLITGIGKKIETACSHAIRKIDKNNDE